MSDLLDLFPDNTEHIHYNYPDFPVEEHKEDLPSHNDRIPLHKHNDLQITLLLQGTMQININGQSIILNESDILFINSNRLHSCFPLQNRGCQFIVIHFHPNFFDSIQILCNLLQNQLSSGFEDYISLNVSHENYNEIRTLILNIDDHIKQSEMLFSVLQDALGLLQYFCKTVQIKKEAEVPSLLPQNLITMIEYIQDNYPSKLSTDDIASSGMVCKSQCFYLFRHYMNTTPIDYLNKYRLIKSCKMLSETSQSLTNIALNCGFQSASYFSYIFKNKYDITPLKYRKTHTVS